MPVALYILVYMLHLLGTLDGFGGLNEVTVYPTCVSSLQRVVVLAVLVLGQIDARWQDTWLTYKQLKHTNSRCPE